MPTSGIDIVNLALLNLKQGGVASLDDDNDNVAVAAKAQYDLSRKSLIRNFNWNFAKRAATLPRVLDMTPPSPYESYYLQPVDCVKFLNFIPRSRLKPPYDIYGRHIAMTGTADSITIEYNADVEDPTIWDALFTQCMVLQLAMDLCPAITGDRGIEKKLFERLQALLPEALAVDHQERMVDVYDIDRMQQSRELLNVNAAPGTWGELFYGE